MLKEGHTKQNCQAQEYGFHCRQQQEFEAEICGTKKYERELIRPPGKLQSIEI